MACVFCRPLRSAPGVLQRPPIAAIVRLAGEVSSTITGADFTARSLECPRLGGLQSGPTDNPEDEGVALDQDADLPWPNAQRVVQCRATRFAQWPSGARRFMGAASGVRHCEQVLRDETQRQRAVAAWQRSLLRPGTMLFPIAAPAWCQQLAGRGCGVTFRY